jgi:hypothetical protein
MCVAPHPQSPGAWQGGESSADKGMAAAGVARAIERVKPEQSATGCTRTFRPVAGPSSLGPRGVIFAVMRREE